MDLEMWLMMDSFDGMRMPFTSASEHFPHSILTGSAVSGKSGLEIWE